MLQVIEAKALLIFYPNAAKLKPARSAGFAQNVPILLVYQWVTADEHRLSATRGVD